MQPDVARWCRGRVGGSPLLLLAPHGGRRDPSRPRPRGRRLRVNDLHTAELAAALAERLDASLVANVGLDRNDLDLNRLSEVQRRAPWFLEQVEELLGLILARHPRAEVLVVHGWNVVQPRCDVGVGHALADERDGAAVGEALTVSVPYLSGRLGSFRRRCARDRIEVTYGDRYAARSPNNLLQVFRRARGAARGRLASWLDAGRVEAVQLELGVPLRWPGKFRDAFLDAATEVFGSAHAGDVTCASNAGEGASPLSRRALQAYDPRAGIGVVAGVGPIGEGALGGRLLVFPGGQVLELFTGEARGASGSSVGDLRLEEDGDRLALRFAGPALHVEDAAAYLDTESALAASRLAEVSVDLDFLPLCGRAYGAVRGHVIVDGRAVAVDTHGFGEPLLIRPETGERRGRTLLAAAFGAHGAVVAELPEGGADGSHVRLTPGRPAETAGATGDIRLGSDPYTPAELRIDPCGGETLIARPVNRMSILRPAGEGTSARITLGVAAVDGGGSGFYEHTRYVAGPAPE